MNNDQDDNKKPQTVNGGQTLYFTRPDGTAVPCTDSKAWVQNTRPVSKSAREIPVKSLSNTMN